MKMACGDKKAACRVAILDPELTLSMPAGVTTATGIDAISHALESYVTTKRNPISQLFARRAWKLLARGFEVVMHVDDAVKKSQANESSPDSSSIPTHGSEPSQMLAARGSMLLGAHLAGAAIENSMLGATHALANPLTAQYGITHGVAIGLMLPHVIRFNTPVVGSLYGRLAEDIGLCAMDESRAGERLAEYVAGLFQLSGSAGYLSAFGVERTMLRSMAGEAARQWTGTFNPRPVDEASLLDLYSAAFDPS